MGTKRIYRGLPLYWHQETMANDQQWLESIVRNTAPFSDAWTKARIVQLAYAVPKGIKTQILYNLPLYGGYTSELEIAQALRSSCNLEEYPDFDTQVNEDYVIRALNSWHNKQFAKAVSRNFEIYVDREYSNSFLVVSTARTSLNVDRQLPPLAKFRPLFNIAEMGRLMRMGNFERLTLKTHGYATPAFKFYQEFIAEIESLSVKGPINKIGTLENRSVYIGYHWPSEMPLIHPGLWSDMGEQKGLSLKFLFIVALLAWIFGTGFYIILSLIVVPLLDLLGIKLSLSPLWHWFNWHQISDLIAQWNGVTLTVFVLWLLLMQILRISVYQRDRYRAIHYGAPDLAEFFWRLDKVLGENPYTSMPFYEPQKETIIANYYNQNFPPMNVNLIGHSMGGLVIINVLRILSDRFGKEDRLEYEKNNMGDYLQLDKLILTSPDIPLEFLREGRNNYVRSAILRCNEIYLFSSDRDLILRYLSILGNWFSEPSIEMSGLRLGNVYLKPCKNPNNQIVYQPYIRVMISSQSAVQPTSAYDLFEKFNYIDCSQMPGLNCISLPLNVWTSLIIDLTNTLFFIAGKVDIHGGYHFTNTTSFDILKFLITRDGLSRTETLAEINHLISGKPVLFLPSDQQVGNSSDPDLED
ncbi:alpha/beta hydrolase [Planktothrix paucivesiculata]|uniref:2-C-methyl-D-erythritol 4-phosphate cytidylyltransferase n=1 Tax=Planktothrix paucivesiculata PCC 9631 TaxID=671071 RepID=A0A7Z9DW66_9CYAN|nr:alpha/beta hydrolase [Planktothrix paucivesiculata]VXD11904.1 2-C-methyl-D-erythritol 4-phosphate cytidylyltransferase [Planktothrix paucivesiculata PCC 9631]